MYDRRTLVSLFVLMACCASLALAQSTPGQLPGTAMPTITSVPPEAQASPNFNADVAIHLGEYRKMSRGTLEEWIFYDHPSGRHRIHDAMVWKAENLSVPQP